MYAIVSDIHSNIEALRAVMEDIRKEPKVQKIICLGDIIDIIEFDWWPGDA